MTASPFDFATSGFAATLVLWVVTAAVLLVAALLLLRLRADSRRDAQARRDRTGLARAYTELSLAKAAAEARSAQMEATLAGMSDGVMMLDSDYRLMQWNDRFPDMTGVPREMLKVGVPMADMIAAQARAGEFQVVDIDAEIKRRVASVRHHHLQAVTERTRPNGQVVELRRNQIPSGGSVTLYSDITARRRAEATQREATAAAAALVEQKAQFVAMVCHEVAAPLHSVLESLRTLDRQIVPAGAGDSNRTALRRALNAADTMAELMRDILDLAQLDAGRLTLREGVFALAPLLTEVIEAQAARAAERGITLTVDITPGLPDRVRGDSGRVRQVLANFTDNAVKFSAPGQVVLRASRLDLGTPMLRLAVVDPGPRIPADQAALLFQPFTRLSDRPEAATKHWAADAPGAGLGLAICARLARAMHGEVGVAAGQAGGNEFWMSLPLRPAEAGAQSDGQPASSAAPPPVTPAPLLPGPVGLAHRRRALVLLVEDMRVNQVVTATKLRRDGHHVDVAASGAEAVELAARRPYDVVLMDLMMPGMSGYEAAQLIRAMPGPAGRVSIFALTAANSGGDRARCMAAGMQGMLSKPVDAAELAAALALWQPAGPGPGPSAPRPAAAPPPPAPAPPSPASPRTAAPEPQSGLLLDAARLDMLRRGLPPGVFADLAAQCVVDMREQLMGLNEALETGVPPAIEAAAHALAGMAGNYGMQAVERRMRRVMAAARAADLTAARAAAEGGQAELARTEYAMDLLLQLHGE